MPLRLPFRRPAAPWRRALAALLLAGLPVLGAAPGLAGADRLPSNEQILRNFRVVALETEFGLVDLQTGEEIDSGIAKWRMPLRVQVLGPVAVADLRLIEDHLADLAATTGHDVSLAEGPRYNVTLTFTEEPISKVWRDYYERQIAAFGLNRAELQGLIEAGDGNACFGTMKVGPDGAIIEGAIFIPAEADAWLTEACIVEETTQLLGLPNDSDDIEPSIFNDSSDHFRLTRHDRLLLRLLYDDEIEPGMSWREVEPIVRRLLQRLNPAG